MDKIWKYTLEITDKQSICMPEVSIMLDVRLQNGSPCLWVRVDPSSPYVFKEFITHVTGQDVPHETGNHIGTYQLNGGSLVFHVFESA